MPPKDADRPRAGSDPNPDTPPEPPTGGGASPPPAPAASTPTEPPAPEPRQEASRNASGGDPDGPGHAIAREVADPADSERPTHDPDAEERVEDGWEPPAGRPPLAKYAEEIAAAYDPNPKED